MEASLSAFERRDQKFLSWQRSLRWANNSWEVIPGLRTLEAAWEKNLEVALSPFDKGVQKVPILKTFEKRERDIKEVI